MEDMPLMCERYATSKLKEYRDLKKLRTFGFRGEALASISQISTVTIVTKHQDSDLGYQ
jgi:DNA mismatch repair protein MLH1